MTHLLHQPVQVEFLDEEAPLPRVGEHLPGEVRGAGRRRLDPVQVLDRRRLRFQPHQGEIGVSHDGGEDVVEIVGDPPRQDPEAFQLLGVEHLFFQLQAFLFRLFSLRDVPGGQDHLGRGDWGDISGEPELIAADGQRVIDGDGLAGRERLMDRGKEQFRIFFGEDFVEPPSKEFVGRAVQLVGTGGGDLEASPLGVKDDDHVGQGGEDGAELYFRCRQGLLGVLSLGHLRLQPRVRCREFPRSFLHHQLQDDGLAGKPPGSQGSERTGQQDEEELGQDHLPGVPSTDRLDGERPLPVGDRDPLAHRIRQRLPHRPEHLLFLGVRMDAGDLVVVILLQHPLDVDRLEELLHADQGDAEPPEPLAAVPVPQENREPPDGRLSPLDEFEGASQREAPGPQGKDRLLVPRGVIEEVVTDRLLVPLERDYLGYHPVGCDLEAADPVVEIEHLFCQLREVVDAAVTLPDHGGERVGG